VLFSLKGNRRSSVALVTCHRLTVIYPSTGSMASEYQTTLLYGVATLLCKVPHPFLYIYAGLPKSGISVAGF